MSWADYMVRAVIVIAVSLVILLVVAGSWALSGSGRLQRALTLGGIYAVCKPGDYDVVCFGDKSSPNGGLACVPLSLAGGKCR